MRFLDVILKRTSKACRSVPAAGSPSLPPENATGNFVKVVQRVPVKIVFDEPPADLERLWAGESVEPKVNVHDRVVRQSEPPRRASAPGDTGRHGRDRGDAVSNNASPLVCGSQKDPRTATMSHAITPSGRAVNPWWIGLTLTIATFMELLDTSIANVSLPHIAGGLGTSLDEATWVLTSYLVANAVVLPLSAWLSRVFGRKKYYMVCVGLFTASSFLCGTGPEPWAPDFLPGSPRDRRRRVSPFGTGHAGGYISSRQTGRGLRALQYGDRDGPGAWADLGRLDHRQFFLALDFFHQYPGRPSVAFPDQSAGNRSACIYRRAAADQGVWQEPDRLCRDSVICGWFWVPGSGPR